MITRSDRRYRRERARARKARIVAWHRSSSFDGIYSGFYNRPIDERDFPWIGRGPRYSKGRVGRSNSPWNGFGFRLKYPIPARQEIAEQWN